MFGRDTHTPKHKKPFEGRPFRTIAIDEVPTPIPKLGTQEPYYESYLWCVNPENSVTPEDIATLHKHWYGKNFTHHTPSEKSNSIRYTQYPESNQRSSQRFVIPIVWGGNKR